MMIIPTREGTQWWLKKYRWFDRWPFFSLQFSYSNRCFFFWFFVFAHIFIPHQTQPELPCCAVCFKTTSALQSCEMCGICVHLQCYFRHTPENEREAHDHPFICDKCQVIESTNDPDHPYDVNDLRCNLCGNVCFDMLFEFTFDACDNFLLLPLFFFSCLSCLSVFLLC